MKKTIAILSAALALILTACSDLSSNQDLYPFSENGKWGYINQNGDVVIKPQYEMANDFVGDYATVLIDSVLMTSEFGHGWNSSWAIINKYGKIQLKDLGPSTGSVTITTDGYAIMCFAHIGDTECYKLIRIKDGSNPFPKLSDEINCDEIKFDNMEDLQRDGILAYHDIREGLWGFLDLNGNIIKPKYSDVFGIQNGIASVQDNESGKYYLIDKSGNRTTKQEYESIVFHMGHNLYSTAIGEKLVFINSEGDIIAETQFADFVDDFNDEGLIYTKILVKDELQYAFADTTGNIVIGPYEELGLWNDSLIYYGIGKYPDQKYGYLDKKGNVVISPRFSQACDFHEGLACTQLSNNEKYGFIDKTGEFVIQPQFDPDYGYEFMKCGLAEVRQGGLQGVIDRTGKFIIEPNYDSGCIHIYDTGMIRVTKNDSCSYINPQGKIIKSYKK